MTQFDELLDELRTFERSTGQSFDDDDGIDFMKSLEATQEANEDHFDDIEGSLRLVVDQNSRLMKALSMMAKDNQRLNKRVRTLQKAVLNLARRVPEAPTERSSANDELLHKAQAAAEAGRITWREFAAVDTRNRNAQAQDQDVVSRIEPLEKAAKPGSKRPSAKQRAANLDPGGLRDRAQVAAEAGAIPWSDFARVDAALRMGTPIPADLLARLDEWSTENAAPSQAEAA